VNSGPDGTRCSKEIFRQFRVSVPQLGKRSLEDCTRDPYGLPYLLVFSTSVFVAEKSRACPFSFELSARLKHGHLDIDKGSSDRPLQPEPCPSDESPNSEAGLCAYPAMWSLKFSYF
jgi:hypothetical protein